MRGYLYAARSAAITVDAVGLLAPLLPPRRRGDQFHCASDLACPPTLQDSRRVTD